MALPPIMMLGGALLSLANPNPGFLSGKADGLLIHFVVSGRGTTK